MVPSSFPPRMRILVDGAGDIRFIGYEPSSPWGIIPFGLCSHRRFRPISECHPVVVPNQTRSVQHLFTIVQYGEVPALALRIPACGVRAPSEAPWQLYVEGGEVDGADAIEELGGPGVGQGLGQLTASAAAGGPSAAERSGRARRRRGARASGAGARRSSCPWVDLPADDPPDPEGQRGRPQSPSRPSTG